MAVAGFGVAEKSPSPMGALHVGFLERRLTTVTRCIKGNKEGTSLHLEHWGGIE